MKVLMQIRSNIFTCPGGDTIQLLNTKKNLEKLGVEVSVSLELCPDLKEYDLVHLFNLTRVQETYIQAQNAKRQGKPIAFSTIYWPNNEFEKIGGIGLRKFIGRVFSINQIERLKALCKFVLMKERDQGTWELITGNYQNIQKEILEMCTVFLPNSILEMQEIQNELDFASQNVVVVPNAVDENAVAKAEKEAIPKEYEKYKGYIICVGRIDARKNQLRLLKALKNTNYKLLLVGKQSPGYKKYYREVMKKVKQNSNIEYIEQIENEKLYLLYKACKVSVLPSWFETPGLVSLEAAAMGCNVVISDKGTTKDYFGDDAFYCDVGSVDSIRKSIDLAWNARTSEKLKNKIIKEYTWGKTAEKTMEGYKLALRLTKEQKDK